MGYLSASGQAGDHSWEKESSLENRKKCLAIAMAGLSAVHNVLEQALSFAKDEGLVVEGLEVEGAIDVTKFVYFSFFFLFLFLVCSLW